MDVNRVPLTRGKVSAAQLANFQKWTKGELRTAIIMGVAGAACWKLVHWSEKRKMTAMNEAVKAENAEVGDVAALLAFFVGCLCPSLPCHTHTVCFWLLAVIVWFLLPGTTRVQGACAGGDDEAWRVKLSTRSCHLSLPPMWCCNSWSCYSHSWVQCWLV